MFVISGIMDESEALKMKIGQHQVPAGASHLGVSTCRDQVEGGTGTCAGTMEWADNLRKGEVNSICSRSAHRRAAEAKLVPGTIS